MAVNSSRVLETDWIDWTEDKLTQRIEETRELLRRLDAREVDDRDFLWIREQLANDLRHKELMLTQMRTA